jgi:hypothetical protein
MTEEQIALAKRAVACPKWRWMPGMRAVGRRNVPTAWFRSEDDICRLTGEWADAAPDLTDPATLGCVLALVREAWEPRRGTDHIASTVHASTGWGVGARVGSECFAAIILPAFSSEAEALVAALEAAP